MKTTILLFLFIAISVFIPTVAQTGFTWQNPKPQGNVLWSVKFINATTGWAVGDNGLVMKSTDGGKSWGEQKSGTKATLSSLFFLNQNTGWAAGANTLIKTTNGGSTWTVLTTSAPTALSSIYFFNQNVGIISGYGQIFRTTDGGSTLTAVASGTLVNFSNMLSLCFINDSLGWSAGTNGRLLMTTNSGNSWSASSSRTSTRLNSIYFSTPYNGLIFGDSGLMLSTADGGITWTSKTIINNHINNCFFVKSSTGWIVTESNSDSITIYKTSNGGQNWTGYWRGSNRALTSVNFIDTVTGWIVGHGGAIVWTTNAGTMWNPTSSGMTTPLTSVFFLNPSLGWAVGEQGGVVRTTDGGNNWISDKIPNSSYLNSVYFINKDTGVIAAGFGTKQIYRTGDGGKTWAPAIQPNYSYFLNSVNFQRNNEGWAGYMAGFNGKILKTTDWGTNWIEKNSGITKDLYSVYFCKIDTGFTAGDNGTILRTNDGGNSWSEQTSGTTTRLFSIFFVDTLNGWAAGNSGTVLRTNNGGISWEKLTTNITSTVYQVQFLNPKTGYAACSYGYILKTTDGGTNWSQLQGPTANWLYSLYFTSVNTGWVVGTYGTILFTSTGGSVVAVQDNLQKTLPVDLTLHQNYPNPFNPVTTINYSVSKQGKVSIIVFDALGREVSTLLNEEKQKGDYTLAFDAKNLSSGVYYYQLKMDGFVQSKKMILLK